MKKQNNHIGFDSVEIEHVSEKSVLKRPECVWHIWNALIGQIGKALIMTVIILPPFYRNSSAAAVIRSMICTPNGQRDSQPPHLIQSAACAESPS